MKLKILIKKGKYLIPFFFLLTSLFISSGQTTSVRDFDKVEMNAYAKQAAFGYMNYTVKPPSIWERLSWWLQSIIQKIFLNPNTTWLTKIMAYLILILVVGAAVFYIVRLKYGGALFPDSQTHGMSVQQLQQNSLAEFDTLINDALNDQNYKLAIRYVYLKSLMNLSKRDLIKLKDWKSPYDYERELKSEIVPFYKELAKLFEYVWYGDFEAGKKEYQNGIDLSNKLEQVG